MLLMLLRNDTEKSCLNPIAISSIYPITTPIIIVNSVINFAAADKLLYCTTAAW